MAILRWSARLLSVALIALFYVFLVGEGIPPFSALSIRTMSLGFWLLVSLAGLLIAFRAEALGGMMGLAGAAGFYLADFIASGSFPRGWVFPLILITSALYLLAWWWRRSTGSLRL